jgi:hypothetical protein
VLALALVAGVAGGVSLAAAAGARRTSTAPARLLEEVDGAGDVRILDTGSADVDSIVALPQVRKYAISAFLVGDVPFDLTSTTDQLYGLQLLRGEVAPDDPLSLVVDQTVARAMGLDVGDRIEVGFYSAEQFAALDASGGPEGPRPTLRVAAVVRDPDAVDAADPASYDFLGLNGTFALPSSFLERYGDQIGVARGNFTTLALHGGSEQIDAFVDEVRALPGGSTVEFSPSGGIDPGVGSVVDLQSRALVVLAVTAGVAGIVVLAQMAARERRANLVREHTLRALGMTRSQRVLAASARGALAGLMGGLIAVALAWSISPLTPIGVARRAEPQPGFDANLLMLLAGFAVVLIIVTAIVGLAPLRAGATDVATGPSGRVGADRVRAPAVGSLLVRISGAPTVRASLSMLSGSRQSRRSSRAAVISVTAAVVVTVGALVVLSTLDEVVHRPEDFGWPFDAVAGSPYTEDQGNLFGLVAGTPGVVAHAPALATSMRVEGRDVSAIGVDPDRGIAAATVRDGREAAGPDEVVLGAATLESLDKQIGDTVTVDAEVGPRRLTVTGVAVLPEIGGFGGAGLGEGAVMRLRDMAAMFPERRPNLALLDLDPDRADQAMASIRRESGGAQSVSGPFLPTRLYAFDRLRGLPVIVAGLAAALAAAVLLHHHAVMGRVHSRDQAVLRALGLTRRQLATTTSLQATTLAVIACWPVCRSASWRVAGRGRPSPATSASARLPTCRSSPSRRRWPSRCSSPTSSRFPGAAPRAPPRLRTSAGTDSRPKRRGGTTALDASGRARVGGRDGLLDRRRPRGHP